MSEVGRFGTEDRERDGCDEEGRGEEGLKAGWIRRRCRGEEVENDVDGSRRVEGGGGGRNRASSSGGGRKEAVVAGKAHQTDRS